MSDSVTLAKALLSAGVSIPDTSLREEVEAIADRKPAKPKAETDDKTTDDKTDSKTKEGK